MNTVNNKNIYYATAKEMEKLDALAVDGGLEIRQMMELAGWHMLSVFRRLQISSEAKIIVVCGNGNKGGDGLSAARHLVNHGWEVTVILLDKKISRDSQHHLALLEKMGVPIDYYGKGDERVEGKIQDADILIDALIGYHLEGAPRDLFQDAINIMNKSGKKIIAYDIPSGVEATTGECFSPCINAFATLSLAMPKRAFQSEQARRVSGSIFIADIGIPSFLYDIIASESRPRFEDFDDSLVTL